MKLIASKKYKITITSTDDKPAFILISKKSTLPNQTSWRRYKETYVYPTIKEIFIDSNELPDTKVILLTIWLAPDDEDFKKGSSKAPPLKFVKINSNKDKFILPYTLEYAYKGKVVKVRISRET